MTVYAVQMPRRRCPQTKQMIPVYDLSPANIYGDVVELLSPTAKPFNPEPIINELRIKLENFSDNDFLICIGNPILYTMAAQIALENNGGRARLLQWHGKRNEYVPITLDFGD